MTDKKYYNQWYAKNRKKRIASVKAYQKKHANQVSAYNKRYKEKHKKAKTEYIKFWNIKRKYGLSKIDYKNLLKKQSNKCALCKRFLSIDEIHVDHCHKSGKVRGLVHQDCNHLIGFSGENIDVLKKSNPIYKKTFKIIYAKRKICTCRW